MKVIVEERPPDAMQKFYQTGELLDERTGLMCLRSLKNGINRMTSPPGCTAVDAEKLRDYNHGLAEENDILQEKANLLEDALSEIAKQNLRDEMDDHTGEQADWEGGYEAVVLIASHTVEEENAPVLAQPRETPTIPENHA